MIDTNLKRAARFLQDRKQLMYPDDGGVAIPLSAFLPRGEGCSEGMVYETSVILHKDDNDIPWDAGIHIFRSDERGCAEKVPVACVDIPIVDIEGAGLSVELKPEKGISQLHANILGWSEDADLRDLTAAVLAGKGRLFIRPGREEAVQRKMKQPRRESNGDVD